MTDFGGKLRLARERRGLSLRQMAASTKIAAASLEALERNDISKLPGGIFSRAFVRSYAIEAGLDPDETVREFLDCFNQAQPPTAAAVAAVVPEEEKAFEQKRRRAIELLVAATGLILILLVVAVFVIRAHRAHAREAAAAAAAAAGPAPGIPTADAPAAAGRTAATPPSSAAAAPATLSLDLHPKTSCWVSLTVDGKTLFSRVMNGGEHETHPVTREAVVEVGDAGAFAFSINGREGRPLGAVGQVKTLKVTPDTVPQLLK